MFKMKEVLSDIVRQAYGEDCNPAYYKFYVEITGKNSKTFHGYYRYKDHRICIYNTYRDDETVLCTTVHELAHHIDYCNRRKSDHQAEFYAEYRTLLYAALDMGIIHKEKFLESEKDASDSNKIRKMMDEYVPHPVKYKSDVWTVSVYNSYEVKDKLAAAGYHFNGNSKAWEKETSDVEAEKEWLSQFGGIRVEMSGATDLHFCGQIVLTATGDTFSIKDELSSAGFRYKNKKWIYIAASEEEARAVQQRFQNVHFVRK